MGGSVGWWVGRWVRVGMGVVGWGGGEGKVGDVVIMKGFGRVCACMCVSVSVTACVCACACVCVCVRV